MRNADYFTLYIQPTYITLVPQYTTPNRSRSNKGQFVPGERTINETSGLLSRKAQSNMKNAINWLLLAAPKKWVYQKSTNKRFQFKINFITLTLPTSEQKHSDTFIKRQLLHPWLIRMGYSHNLKNYIWKAETTGNGTIHFHITTDTFIHHKDLRRAWNKQLERHGYIDLYTAKHSALSFQDYLKLYPPTNKTPLSKRRAAYNFGVSTNWNDPNSTDVHAVKNVQNLGAYMCKYLTKNDLSRRSISGKIWSASSNICASNKLTIDSFDLPVKDYHSFCNYKGVTTVHKDFFSLHFFSPLIWFDSAIGILSQYVMDHIAAIRHNWAKSPPLLTYTIP